MDSDKDITEVIRIGGSVPVKIVPGSSLIAEGVGGKILQDTNKDGLMRDEAGIPCYVLNYDTAEFTRIVGFVNNEHTAFMPCDVFAAWEKHHVAEAETWHAVALIEEVR